MRKKNLTFIIGCAFIAVVGTLCMSFTSNSLSTNNSDNEKSLLVKETSTIVADASTHNASVVCNRGPNAVGKRKSCNVCHAGGLTGSGMLPEVQNPTVAMIELFTVKKL